MPIDIIGAIELAVAFFIGVVVATVHARIQHTLTPEGKTAEQKLRQLFEHGDTAPAPKRKPRARKVA